MTTTKEKTAATLPRVVPLTMDEKFAELEEMFAALEKKYVDLQDKVLASTENAPDEADSTTAKVAPSDYTEEANTVSAIPQFFQCFDFDVTKVTAENNADPASRAKIVINRKDPISGERRDQPSNEGPSPAAETTTHAFVLRKNVDKDGEEDDGEIEITSPKLWSLLKERLGHYPGHVFQGPSTLLYSPYKALVLNWDSLEDAAVQTANDDEDKQARSDLKLLLDTISNGSGDLKLDKYFKNRESSKLKKSVTFDTLWTIFPPGTLIFGKPFQGQNQVFLVQNNVQPWPSSREPWTLSCWTYDVKDEEFRRIPLRLEFERFEGWKAITSLPYYPFDLHAEKASVKKELIQRGHQFRKFSTAVPRSRLCEYKGDAILVQQGFSGTQDNDNDGDSMMKLVTLEVYRRLYERQQASDANIAAPKSIFIDTRVMVDYKSYFQYGPLVACIGSVKTSKDDRLDCGCLQCRENKGLQAIYRTSFDEDSKSRGTWEDEQLILCPPRVLGYIFNEKQWAQLQVTNLRVIPEDDGDNSSWHHKLKLADETETKDLILDLVRSHASEDSESGTKGLVVNDLVVRKGKGLVMLFYGPPGVGKTSTAETVAYAARKPFFPISVADVGTKAKDVEARLATIFALASSWQAILLIDEADVFLESRGRGIAGTMERNALVSVFLRVLEYYQGILILTTNQIAQFDVAVQSRVHIAIKYSKLSKKQTQDIFDVFLEPLARKGLVRDIDDIRKWIEEDVWRIGLDGRQIRNVVTSALGLTRARGKLKLEKQDLKTVCNNVREFRDDFVNQFEKYKNEQLGMVG